MGARKALENQEKYPPLANSGLFLSTRLDTEAVG